MRRALVLALATGVAVASGLWPATACGDDQAPTARRAAERAFFDGRYDALDGLLPSEGPDSGALERHPLAVRDQVWRLRVPPAVASASGPGAGAAAAELWPLVTALVDEREVRESLGVAGVTPTSPLEAAAGRDWVAWQAAIYRPVPPEEDPDAKLAAQARAQRDRARDLRSDALLQAALGVLGLLAAAALAGGLLGSIFRPPRTSNAPRK